MFWLIKFTKKRSYSSLDMEMLSVLALLFTVASSASLECKDGNCTDPVPLPMLTFFFRSFLPIQSSESVEDDTSYFDQAIDPVKPAVNSSNQDSSPEDIIVIKFTKIISFTDDDSPESGLNLNPVSKESSQIHKAYDMDDMFRLFSVLDLTGETISGDDLARILEVRAQIGRPVEILIMKDCRVQGFNSETFKAVESTLQDLTWDNCSAGNNLESLSGLVKLTRLSLKNNGLNMFPWLPKLSMLKILDLSHNEFVEIRPELSTLESLRSLNISNNRIGKVGENPLALLPNLETLSLTMNSLEEANLANLVNLKLVELDWNYLWRAGQELLLPPQPLSVRLSSNPWRCDCGLLQARDNYDVLDIDQLECANQQSFTVCEGCKRYFLPMENGRPVGNLTKSSIEHLGCTGLADQMYLFRNAINKLAENEPEKLVRTGMMAVAFVFIFIAAVVMCRRSCAKRKFDKKSWLEIQQIPFLQIDKLGKPQEVPYFKMDSSNVKA